MQTATELRAAYAATDAQGRWLPALEEARINEIAAEIEALTGCERRTARRAAGGFMDFPGCPKYGLGGAEGCGYALSMLERWIEAKITACQREAA